MSRKSATAVDDVLSGMEPERVELMTQGAADLLGVSQTYLILLIEAGKLPALGASVGRRLLAADVIAYEVRRDARLAGVDAIADADAAAGVPYR